MVGGQIGAYTFIHLLRFGPLLPAFLSALANQNLQTCHLHRSNQGHDANISSLSPVIYKSSWIRRGSWVKDDLQSSAAAPGRGRRPRAHRTNTCPDLSGVQHGDIVYITTCVIRKMLTAKPSAYHRTIKTIGTEQDGVFAQLRQEHFVLYGET